MAFNMTSVTPHGFVEHIGVFVNDMDWYIRFFEHAFGMGVMKGGAMDASGKCWLHGGVQLVPRSENDGAGGRMDHIGIMVDDLAEAERRVKVWDGIKELPSAREDKKWFLLPDGLLIELMQARPGSVEKFYDVRSRYR